VRTLSIVSTVLTPRSLIDLEHSYAWGKLLSLLRYSGLKPDLLQKFSQINLKAHLGDTDEVRGALFLESMIRLIAYLGHEVRFQSIIVFQRFRKTHPVSSPQDRMYHRSFLISVQAWTSASYTVLVYSPMMVCSQFSIVSW